MLNVVGDLVMKDQEKSEILAALFPWFFTSKVSPQASQISMPSGKVWRRLLGTVEEG